VSSPLTASPDRASPSGKVTVSALSRTARRRAPRAKCVRVNPSLITVHLKQSAAARSVETCLRPHLADEGSPLLWWRARGWPAPCLWPSTNATHCSTLLYLMVTACCAPGGDLVLHVLSTGTAGDQRACRLANFGPPNTGAPWRDVPERYGPWGRACDLFRRWQSRWHLGQDRHPPPGRGGCEGPDHLGPERRLHLLPGPRAHGRAGEKGDLQRNRPAALPSNRPTTASDAPGAG
jgi:hypothetical protein